MEEVCHYRWALKFQKPTPAHILLSEVYLSDTALVPYLPVSYGPPIMMVMGSSAETVSNF